MDRESLMRANVIAEKTAKARAKIERVLSLFSRVSEILLPWEPSERATVELCKSWGHVHQCESPRNRPAWPIMRSIAMFPSQKHTFCCFRQLARDLKVPAIDVAPLPEPIGGRVWASNRPFSVRIR